MSTKEHQQDPKFASRVRMTSIEAFHLHSSSFDWPNCVTSRYHFRGSIDVDLAKQAWNHCLGRQKFATWPIVGVKGRPKWSTNVEDDRFAELAADSFHRVIVDQWPETESAFELPMVNDRGLPQVAAGAQVGFGLWCIQPKAGDRVTLIFAADHALADGLAAITFVRDWMLAYNNLCSKEDIDRGLTQLDWNRWKTRSHLGLLSWSFLKFLPCQAIGLFGATKFILRKFSTIEPSESAVDSHQTPQSPGIVGRTVSPEVLRELSDRAERLGVSANSLLMTIIFRSMKSVKKIVEADSGCDWAERKWIRLVLPIGIRGIADRKLPSTNKASLVQIERTFEQVASADGAAQSLDREVRIIMGFKLDLVFLIAIRLLSAIPMLLRFAAGNQKSRGTTVFSNLGEPFRKTRTCNFRDVGDLRLEEYDLCGPLRSGTPISFAWSTFKQPVGDDVKSHGRVSLHFDRRIVSPDLAFAIVDAVEKELRDVAQFGGSAG